MAWRVTKVISTLIKCGRVERELLSSFRGEAPYRRVGGSDVDALVARRNTNNGRLELDVRPSYDN